MEPEAELPDFELKALQKAMRRIARALELQSRRIDRAIGLTLPQLVVLGAVRDLGAVTSRAISRDADLSPPTVAGILDKLEAKGLVERKRSAEDRRIVHALLTETGRAALDRAPAAPGARFRQGFAALPEGERVAILRAFDSVAGLLEGAEPVEDPPQGQDW